MMLRCTSSVPPAIELAWHEHGVLVEHAGRGVGAERACRGRPDLEAGVADGAAHQAAAQLQRRGLRPGLAAVRRGLGPLARPPLRTVSAGRAARR